MNSDRGANLSEPSGQPVMQKILAALQGLRFGSVEITVHEGNVVQIERREKLRLNPSGPEGGHKARDPRSA